MNTQSNIFGLTDISFWPCTAIIVAIHIDHTEESFWHNYIIILVASIFYIQRERALGHKEGSLWWSYRAMYGIVSYMQQLCEFLRACLLYHVNVIGFGERFGYAKINCHPKAETKARSHNWLLLWCPCALCAFFY